MVYDLIVTVLSYAVPVLLGIAAIAFIFFGKKKR